MEQGIADQIDHARMCIIIINFVTNEKVPIGTWPNKSSGIFLNNVARECRLPLCSI